MIRFDVYIAYFRKLAPTSAERCEGLEPEERHTNRGRILAFQSPKFSESSFLSLSLTLLFLLLHSPLKLQQSSNLWPSFLLQLAKGGHFQSREAHLYLGRIDGDPVLRETRIWATWEYVSSVGGGQQGMIVIAAQLIHDRVEMECLEGAWETLEGNTRCRFRGTIRFTATSLVHPDEPVRTLQRTMEWILPTPTPYRLVEPVQVIEVTSSEEDPEEDPEELPPEPAVDALDFLEGDEDPLPEVDSPEDVMSASEADSTEDSGPGEMAISGGSSS
ncbi:hypothetical protein HKD37_04G010441 [Glycine soja]